jgi:hypothetical protein
MRFETISVDGSHVRSLPDRIVNFPKTGNKAGCGLQQPFCLWDVMFGYFIFFLSTDLEVVRCILMYP